MQSEYRYVARSHDITLKPAQQELKSLGLFKEHQVPEGASSPGINRGCKHPK